SVALPLLLLPSVFRAASLSLSSLMIRPLPRPTLFPYTTLFRSGDEQREWHHSAGWQVPKSIDPGCTSRIANHTSGMPEWRLFAKDRKSTRLNSSHVSISYAVFCLKKKINIIYNFNRRYLIFYTP